MPIDPQARVVLDQLAALGGAPLHTLSPAEARAQSNARRAGMPPGAPVARVQDLSAPGPRGDIPLRLYHPDGTDPLPLVVYFHGGGWVIGSIASHDAICRSLANASGSIIVSVEYRVAPEHKFPAAVDDAYAATRWVADHAEALGGDALRLAVAGDSAGGNLAAVTALMARERGGPQIAFQLLIYPVTDFNLDTPSYMQNAEGYLLTRDTMSWFWNHYLSKADDGAHPYTSPLRADDLSGLPPALVITAEFDPLRDEGEAYAERLRQAGVPVTCTRYDGMIHSFIGMELTLDQAKDAIRQAGDAVRQALAPQA
jgi:acetyl esterase